MLGDFIGPESLSSTQTFLNGGFKPFLWTLMLYNVNDNIHNSSFYELNSTNHLTHFLVYLPLYGLDFNFFHWFCFICQKYISYQLFRLTLQHIFCVKLKSIYFHFKISRQISLFESLKLLQYVNFMCMKAVRITLVGAHIPIYYLRGNDRC